jgi:hypothetical protein
MLGQTTSLRGRFAGRSVAGQPRLWLSTLCFVLLIPPCCAWAQGGERGTPWTVQEFTSLPPIVAELIYQYHVVERPDLQPQFHLVRWQTNAYLHRKGSNLEALTEPLAPGGSDELCGIQGGECWTVTPMSTTKYTLMVGITGQDGTNPEWDSVRPRWALTAYVLNLGVKVPQVGGLLWEGNRFTEAGGLGPFEASGELFESDGRADHLDVKLKRRRASGPDLHQRVTYGYGQGDVPPGLPSRIEVRGLDTAGRVQFTEVYQIHALRLSETPLAAEAFSVAPFLVSVPFVEGRREAGKPTKARVAGGPWQRVYPANPDRAGVRPPSVWGDMGTAGLLLDRVCSGTRRAISTESTQTKTSSLKMNIMQRLAIGFMAVAASSLLIAATAAPATCQKLVISQCYTGSQGGACTARCNGTGRHDNEGTVTDLGLRDACKTAYTGESGTIGCRTGYADNFCRYTCSPLSGTCTECGATVEAQLRGGPYNDLAGLTNCIGTVPNPYE